ncbi:hypothetical protein GF318_04335 [Candidatus Micrarchaeota archaeon]|nr:hypothetical protein [Candidatus Micrarchaeota archaeon]
MRKMSNLEYSFMVRELSHLAGKHFNRIRKIEDDTYRMKIGSTEILCQLGVRLHRTMYLEEPSEKDSFVQKVEKELDNAKLLSIEQINNDRIVAFHFALGTLVFEMFGKGNAILVKDNQVVATTRKEKWADREIFPGSEYRPPKNRPAGAIQPSEKYIIVSLLKLPFGKEYALEALRRAGIDEKTPGESLSGEQISSLEKEFENIREAANPVAYTENGKIIDFSLTGLGVYSGCEKREYGSLSELLDEYYQGLERPDEHLEKLERRLEKQKERLEELKKKEEEYRQKGDFIYEHYGEVQEILDAAEKKEFKDWKLNKKEKYVEVEIQ